MYETSIPKHVAALRSLPEENLADLLGKLAPWHATEFTRQVKQHLKNDDEHVTSFLSRRFTRENWGRFRDMRVVIRYAFPRRDENLGPDLANAKYLFARLRLQSTVVDVLQSLVTRDTDALRQFAPIVANNTVDRADLQELATAFRLQDKWLGLIGRLIDVIENYERTLDSLRSDYEEGYCSALGERHVAHTYEWEIRDATLELLFSRRFGASTAAPLLRCLLELLVVRGVCRIDKHPSLGKHFVRLKRKIRFDEWLKHAEAEDLDLPYKKDELTRLYDMVSQAHHLGYRLFDEDLCFLYIILSQLWSGWTPPDRLTAFHAAQERTLMSLQKAGLIDLIASGE